MSKSKRLSEILREIRTSTYQICRIEEKIKRTTTFYKRICNLTPEVRDILKILWKRGETDPEEQFLPFSTIFCYLLLDFYAKTRTKEIFEISGVDIAIVYCIMSSGANGCESYFFYYFRLKCKFECFINVVRKMKMFSPTFPPPPPPRRTEAL